MLEMLVWILLTQAKLSRSLIRVSTAMPAPMLKHAPRDNFTIEEEEACAGIDAARAPTAEVIEAIPEDTPEGQDDESAAAADWQLLSTATTVSTSAVVVKWEEYD